MLQLSFRSLVRRSFPRSGACKPLAVPALAAILAGCGGSVHEEASSARTVQAVGFSFAAPSGWTLTRGVRTVGAGSGDELVSVTRFRLARPYRPALWPKVVPVLDGVAAELARGLGGRVDTRGTVVIAGRRARSYELSFSRDGKDLAERIAFVLAGRREYQLLCRYRRGSEPKACDAFLASFRPA